MTSHASLSPTQTLILAAAAQRRNRLILPLPDECRLVGGTRTRVLAVLVRVGLVEEIAATRAAPAWRENEAGQRLTLRVTKAGLDAVRAKPAELGEPLPVATVTKTHVTRAFTQSKSKSRSNAADINAPRTASPNPDTHIAADANVEIDRNAFPDGTGISDPPPCPVETTARQPSNSPTGKLGLLLTSLTQKGGTTIDTLTNLTGWLPHTTRAAMTRLRQRGHNIVLVKQDGHKAYQIVEPAEEVVVDGQI